MFVLLGVLVSFVGRGHWGKRAVGFRFLFVSGRLGFFFKLVCPLMKRIWGVKVGS